MTDNNSFVETQIGKETLVTFDLTASSLSLIGSLFIIVMYTFNKSL